MNKSELITNITNNITQNGTGAITGLILQGVLQNIVQSGVLFEPGSGENSAQLVGNNNTNGVNGDNSLALGIGLETSNNGEVAIGTYNRSIQGGYGDPGTIFTIGIGDDRDQKNALTIMDNGDVYIYGIGGYDGENIDEYTETLQQVLSGSSSLSNTNSSNLLSNPLGSSLTPGEISEPSSSNDPEEQTE